MAGHPIILEREVVIEPGWQCRHNRANGGLFLVCSLNGGLCLRRCHDYDDDRKSRVAECVVVADIAEIPERSDRRRA
jgi:hypothetical protein